MVLSLQERLSLSFMGGIKAGHIEAESQSLKIVILKVLGKKISLSIHLSPSQEIWLKMNWP